MAIEMAVHFAARALRGLPSIATLKRAMIQALSCASWMPAVTSGFWLATAFAGTAPDGSAIGEGDEVCVGYVGAAVPAA